MLNKLVYPFGHGLHGAEGLAGIDKIIEVLGGKGGKVAVMANYGLPVPPGFTISTEVCAYYYGNGKTYPPELDGQVQAALTKIEKMTGRRFADTADLLSEVADPQMPLLVSVRSGARASMPGMMDTILNIGLNNETLIGLGKSTGNWRFALDSYRRLIQMYSDVVLGIEKSAFDEILDQIKKDRRVTQDTDLTAEDWKDVVVAFLFLVIKRTGRPFPQDPYEQLWGAIGAVFGSWMNPRAIKYRRLENIPDDWGTAVTIQQMVFGNMGDDCATGVAFTRNPSTGEHELYGEFLINAQGEDVVAGIRTPLPLAALQEKMPGVFNEFKSYAEKLEKHFRDMQDMEFTVERGKLWMLQTRNGKRTARASIKIAVDMVNEGLITKKEAVTRVKPSSLDQLFHPIIDPAHQGKPWLKGLPASPGAVCGNIFLDAEEAIKRAAKGKRVILVREETCPDDIGGMHAAIGILTARGGMTSHAAVVARGMGKPCIVGASGLHVDYEDRKIVVNGKDVLSEGGQITFDGMTGNVYQGEIKTVEPTLPKEYYTLMEWADKIRRLKIRANAETPTDARKAREMGAEGIGLCRTEHMFFEPEERRLIFCEMIMADDTAERYAALDKLLPMQRADFVELFTIMAGLPVTIRLLDPPLHEFLPKTGEEFHAFAKKIGKSADAIRQRARSIEEANPMLGLRGCRLGIVYPEIYEMQTRAILEAAILIETKTRKLLQKTEVRPEIMVPLIASPEEFKEINGLIRRTANAVMKENGVETSYQVGTMIELPRACMLAGKIAGTAEFLSFGTNDLTQTALGISRDDAGTFLGHYVDKGIMPADPFVTIDQEGVGEHVQIAVERARKVRPTIKIGVCGEHGGDPESIEFFEQVGLDYVSCSPFRVPIARLAAAQAAIAARHDQKK